MMEGYQKGGMADDMGRALKRKTKDAMGRAMPKMPPMSMGMKKGGECSVRVPETRRVKIAIRRGLAGWRLPI